MDRQYVVTKEKANFRQEPDMDGAILAELVNGTIVHRDPDRKQDGEWLPVLLVRGWMHQSTVKEVKPNA